MKHISHVAARNLGWMYRVFMLLAFTIFAGIAQAQNINRVEYFIDTDPGFGLATSIPFTASANITIPNSSIIVTSLSAGFHTFYVRARDVNGKWSITHNRAFYKESISLAGILPNVNKAEYFIDTDPGFGAGINIPITAGTNVSNIALTASVTSLASGFHTFFVRVRDANGKWSITHNRAFYKENISINAPLANVNKAEYFFDTDPGFDLGVNLPFTAGINVTNISLIASVSSLPAGFHTFFVRVRDANGKWSITHNRAFYKENISLSAPLANVNKAEYFFDTDPGFGLGVNLPFTAGTNVTNIPLVASVTTLSTGFHTFFVRVRDANGKWSIAHNRAFYKESISISAPLANINKAEYFFDTDPGFGLGVNLPFTAGTNVTNIPLVASITTLPTGFHTFFVRVRDANGKWSIAHNRAFYKEAISLSAPLADVNKAEYFFDTDPGFGLGSNILLTPAANISSLAFQADVNGLSIGSHKIYTRVRDANGKWSIINTATFDVVPPSTPEIITSNIVGSPFCEGQSISVPFTANTSFGIGNVFSAQLSNSSGVFPITPNIIGTLTNSNAGTINAILPIGISSGSGYRVRVVSSNPVVIGIPNNVNLTINLLPSVTLSPLANVSINNSAFILTGGSPIGGIYSGSGVSGNNFDPAVAGVGSFTINYTFTNASGCASSATRPIVVNPIINAPTALTANASSTSQINLNWISNSTNNTEFRIDRSLNAGGPFVTVTTVTSNFTTFSNNGLIPATTYFYRIVAINSTGGVSLPSNVATATTQNNATSQTITFNQPALTFGVSPVNLVAGASSGLPVSFSIQSGGAFASLSGTNNSVLTILGTGTIVIRASQAGNASFSAAPDVDRTIIINKANPVVTWPTPAAITFPTAISATQLNASANVAGSFVYNPASGTVLNSGNQSINVTFNPTDGINYNSVTTTVVQTVNRANPVLTFNNPANIEFPTQLSGTQLNASSSVAGTFVYNPGNGTSLPAGSGQLLTANFTPTSSNFNTGTVTALINVTKGNPVITWANPAAINVGTALSGTQLNAVANVSGTFSYNPVAGTLLPAGNNQTLNTIFTPTDASNYNTINANAQINVNSLINPVITWTTPSAITFGTALSAAQLNATANTPGTFSYSPAMGTILNAGNQTLSVLFTPTDGSTFNSANSSVTLVINKANPILTWATPSAITFGTALSGTQLNASANVAGTFTYNPLANAIPNAGTQTLAVSFVPTSANFNNANATVQLLVNKATPIISWANPGNITVGTALSATQLNATANVAGTFVYNPSLGFVLGAGNGQTLNTTFTPIDAANYNQATANVLINVNNLQTPVITWPVPTAITFGTALSATQLNATANTGGSFTYSPALGAILNAGTQTLNVQFNPTNTAQFSPVSVSVNLLVNKANPVLTFNNPANITYPTALSATQLSSTADVAGTFSYTPVSGTILNAGALQVLTANFIPTSSNYNNASITAQINVQKGNPVISWANPSAITLGTALSATQLNATADVAGTFSYNPAIGTILPAGNNQTLNTIFTPTDIINYNNLNATAQINVNSLIDPIITWATPTAITFGTALSATQLNATANTAGTFIYATGLGTVLDAGNRLLKVQFIPTDLTTFNIVNASVTLIVNKANPVITWANPSAITLGTALSATQLNATADVAGTFSYNPAIGTILPAGNNQTLNTIFTPTDIINYNNVNVTAQINVNSLIDPIITWANPTAITFGTALSATQLNATANTAGIFIYATGLGTVLDAGNRLLKVQFIPTDLTTFNIVNASITLVVNKANPVITWANPSAITFGTAINASQLNATANVIGTFTYNPLSGSILNAGNQTLSVSFVPTSANYNNASATVQLLINKATPIISWANPANIILGTALSETQLNASANIGGTFVYNPAAGTLLPVGNNQLLNVSFTPNNVANYNQASASVQINVTTVPIGNCTASGTILYEFWQNVSGNLVSNIPVATLPNLAIQRTSFEGYTNSSDNYGSRMRGYVCAPQTGNYIFYIASDEQGKLFLSTDDNPANKVEIASVDGFTGAREWNKFLSQQSVAIALVAGQRYYIEALQKESTGGDNLAVGWKLPNNSFERPIAGNRLSPFDPGINVPPTIAINLPNNNSFYGIGASIPVNATARDIYGFVQQVEFFVNGISVGLDNRSPYTTTLTGLLAGSYTITAVATDDDGMQTTSSNVEIEISSPIEAECLATGTIEREVWNNVLGTNIFQIPLSTSPSALSTLTSFEGPQSAGDNYGARIRGYVCPPQTGYYTFYIASDDKSELWLSSDSTSTNAVKIASVNSFTSFRQWNKFPNQKSAAINLLAGKKYYIHALHKEGSQFDHVSVGWELPDGTLDRPISGLYLAPYAQPTIGRMNVVSNTYSSNWLNLNVYPNPFSTETRIEWKSGITAATQILLFDMNGRVVKKIFEGNSTENQTYFYNLNAENLDAGIYTLKVITNENVNQQKIVFTK